MRCQKPSILTGYHENFKIGIVDNHPTHIPMAVLLHMRKLRLQHLGIILQNINFIPVMFPCLDTANLNVYNLKVGYYCRCQEVIPGFKSLVSNLDTAENFKSHPLTIVT